MCPCNYDGGWRDVPTAVLKLVKQKKLKGRRVKKKGSSSSGQPIFWRWAKKRYKPHRGGKLKVCLSASAQAFREGERERWRERESKQLLIWTHRPSPVSAHSNVCPARLTQPRVAPITHNPALPTALPRHRFEGFTEQILAVVHIRVEPSSCVVRLQFMARKREREKKKEPSPNPPINELSSHLVTRHLKSYIKFEWFIYKSKEEKKQKQEEKGMVSQCLSSALYGDGLFI